MADAFQVSFPTTDGTKEGARPTIGLTPSACARTRAREIIEEFPSDRHSDRMNQGSLASPDD
jgi:hypothetical protein